MGTARIKISTELLKDFLDLPKGWVLETAYVEGDSAHSPADDFSNLCLVVRGDSIEQREPPVELKGIFQSRVIEGEDGRWVQGHWEVYR